MNDTLRNIFKKRWPERTAIETCIAYKHEMTVIYEGDFLEVAEEAAEEYASLRARLAAADKLADYIDRGLCSNITLDKLVAAYRKAGGG